MKNPYVSIFSIENLPHKTNELIQLWESFVTSQDDEAVKLKIRKNVLESWKRCQENGVNPRQSQTEIVLSSNDLRDCIEHSELYSVAKPIIDDTYHKMAGTGYLFTLADAHGRIIYLKGDQDVQRKAQQMNFSLGTDWSERSAGTNSIGTSITSGNPIQILSAEHYCEGCHPWTCSAAPITHPFTKEIIGTIDFTGLWKHAQPHTLGFAIAIAKAIESELSIHYEEMTQRLTDVYFEAINKWKTNDAIVVNEAFFCVHGSRQLLQDLNITEGTNLRTSGICPPIIENLAHNQTLHQEQKIQDYLVVNAEPIYFKDKKIGYVFIFMKSGKVEHDHSSLLNKTWKGIIGHSKSLTSTLYKCQKAAYSNAPILIMGESGTGKEKIAQAIHSSSHRSNQPFLAINCGALQKDLIASELFGYESGTFTGAARDGKKGKFEEANGGTLFLDEIGEMPLDLQVHLLRVLQEKEVTRLGGVKTIPVNVRIIAATHKNLRSLCQQGLFREDLFFRLNVVSVRVPPLRERGEDVLLLSEFFLDQFHDKYDKPPFDLGEEAMHFLQTYSWPGNIRELQNAMEHAAIFCETSTISLQDLPSYLLEQPNIIAKEQHPTSLPPVNAEERKIIIQLLKDTDWNISAVAQSLQMARTTLYRKMKKYKINKTVIPSS